MPLSRYKVIAAVLVPTDSEMKRRSDKRTREDGKDVPESAVMEMKANFQLPDRTEDFFDEIRYVELSQVWVHCTLGRMTPELMGARFIN